MKCRLIVTPRAERVLDAIYEYGKEQSGSRAACKFVGELVKQIKSLSDQPRLGFREPLLEGREVEYRSLVIHKYFKAVYVLDEVAQCIYVVDVWDTRMLPEDLADRVRRFQ